MQLAFDHIEPHFNVFHETAFDNGHSQHFITGSGGLLQAFVFGYSGMRISRLGALSFASRQPILPPLGVTDVKLRGLDLLGTSFDFYYNATTICAGLQATNPPSSSPLLLRLLSSGATFPLSPGSDVTCVPLQPVEVAGPGF